MKPVLTLALALGAMAIAAALSHVIGLESARLQLAAVIVAYASASLTNAEGALCAFAVGYFEDVLSGHPTWLFPLAAMVAYLAGRVVVVVVHIGGALGFAVLAVLVDAAYQAAALGMLAMFPGRGGGPSTASLAAFVPTALLAGVGALLLHPLLQRLDLAFDREESSLSL